MPYTRGNRLPGERASKIGHLQVVKSELVGRLVREFQSDTAQSIAEGTNWEPVTTSEKPLSIVFAVDGSQQPIIGKKPPYKELMFVKTALLRIDAAKLEKIDKSAPHPFALRDLLKDAAVYHSTVFPLRHIWLPGETLYHTVRKVAFESLRDDLSGSVLETLKWLAYEKWTADKRQLELFECPHCHDKVATLLYDQSEGDCPGCGKHIYITDMLGFHQEMTEDFASENVPSSYRAIHETLLVFTGIKYFWEKDRKTIPECLFVKDGPLSLRAQYSKLVIPIRKFLSFSLQAD